MSFTVFGGQLRGPLCLSIAGAVPVPLETMKQNKKKTAARGFRSYRDEPPAMCKLAVVGGGHTAANHVEELRGWLGHVWAINGAWHWCEENGIDATFISADPHPIVAKWATGARCAILEECCDPSVLEVLKGSEIITFSADGDNGGICGRGSTATAIPHLACRMKYTGVTFFGCESSYPQGKTHLYQHEQRDEELLLEVDGVPYLTAPDFMVQAVELAHMIRELEGFLEEKSGGLLGALVRNPEFQIKWVSEAMVRGLSDLERVA